MATAYHQEALRKQRILERKKEAAIRMEAERQGIFEPAPRLQTQGLNPTAQTDTYGTNRPGLKPDIMDDPLIFNEITHDPNFNFRIRKDEKEPPIHVDPIYRIMYPNGLREVNPKTASQLDKFRVNDEGFKNRFRNRAHLTPHVDRVYEVLYSENCDNADYTMDENRNNRLSNKALDKYEAERVLNGHLHVRVQQEFPF